MHGTWRLNTGTSGQEGNLAAHLGAVIGKGITGSRVAVEVLCWFTRVRLSILLLLFLLDERSVHVFSNALFRNKRLANIPWYLPIDGVKRVSLFTRCIAATSTCLASKKIDALALVQERSM